MLRDDDFDEYYDPGLDDEEDDFDCGFDPKSGICSYVGSEECEWECPYRSNDE